MEQDDSADKQVDEDELMKSQMEKMVDSYEAYMSEATFGQERALRETTVNLAQVKSGDCILEAGCGTGTLTIAAKRQVGSSGKAFGIDVIPGMIELSQRKAAEANEEVTFQLGNIDDIPFPGNLFDAVMCSFMIFHMSENTRRKGIAEIQRVLKPQGRLLILDLASPTQPPPGENAQEPSGGVPQHDLRDLLPLMVASGFSDVEIGPVEFRIQGPSSLAFLRASARKS
jgi:ubiquinone/menaquinone biosynthesis C-methylase UbiE